MSDGIKLSETPEVPQESREVTEARQQIEQVTFEPEAAVEKVADIKTAEAVEAAVKEAVEAAVPTADGGRETGDREVAADTATEDGGPVTEDREAEAIETILTSDIANTSASTDASRDAYKEAIDTLQEHAQRQNEVADIGSRPSAPPEGDPAAEDPSDESPVQAVSSTAAETSTDFTAEMTGAQPGEVRGFVLEEDGSKTYELKTDGQTETQTVQEHLEDLEAAQGTPAENAEAVTLRPVGETASPVEQGSPESGEAQRGDELKEDATPTLEPEYAGEGISPEAAKAVGGGGSPAASSLTLDDEMVTSESDKSGIGEEGNDSSPLPVQETSPESLEEGLTLQAVEAGSVTIAGARVDLINRETDSTADVTDDSASYQPQPEDFQTGTDRNGDPIIDEEAYQRALDWWQASQESTGEEDPQSGRSFEFLTRPEEEDLAESDRDPIFNLPLDGEASGEGDEESEYPPEPQLEDYQTGTDENGDPIYDQEAYNQAMAEWQTNVNAIALKVGEEPPYFPVNLDLHSESDMRDYYQGVLNKIAHAKSVLHNEIENWPEDGDHSFTLNIPFKVSDRPLLYVDSYRTISSIEEAQHALDSWNFDDLKYMEDQLVPK